LVVLAAQVGPAGLPVFAGLAHTAYHAMAAAQARQHARVDHHVRAGAVDAAQLVHSHGPTEAPHSHTVVVDRALALAGDGGDPVMGPTSSAEQLDRHVPAAPAELVVASEVTSVDPRATPRAYGHLTFAPPVPPPRG
jgi:hypothetical protein